MRSVVIVVTAVVCLCLSGCGSCRDGGGGATPDPSARATDDGGARETPEEDDEGEEDAGDEASEADGAAPIRPSRPPQVVAQRFVVGWATRDFEALGAISAERAAELVRQAEAGEVVDTPLGRLASDGPRPTSFSFSDMSLAEIQGGVVRVAFTATMRYAGGDPVPTEHVLLVRLSDGVVVDWLSPTVPSGSGV